MNDAVFSVANYLKTNGWGETEDEQRKAVFHYNNSSAYVDAVLKLAELIKE
jgi:membrane-bound lytic murein transglycosylase B